MNQALDLRSGFMTIDQVKIEIGRTGTGEPLVFLGDGEERGCDQVYIDYLSRHFEVITPVSPGFGLSDWPEEFQKFEDLVNFHLTFVDELGLENALLVGCSFGGWLAAEIAIRSPARYSRLVLCGAYGIKVGQRTDRDIVDLFAITQDEKRSLAFHDGTKSERSLGQMDESDFLALARSREAQAFFGWQPYMHNPSLKRWLRRIRIPTLVLWGASDRIVPPEYGRSFAREIPNSTFHLIDEAGHYPHVEQPAAFANAIHAFAAGAHV